MMIYKAKSFLNDGGGLTVTVEMLLTPQEMSLCDNTDGYYDNLINDRKFITELCDKLKIGVT